MNHRDEIVALLALCDSEAAQLSESDLRLLIGELRVFHETGSLDEIVRRPLADGRSVLDVLLQQGGYEAQWAIRYDAFAHGGPFEAFSSTGQVDPEKLSSELGIPLSVLANAFGTALDRFIESPYSAHVQWNAMELLGALNQLVEHTRNKQSALAWLKTPQEPLGGRTPIDALNEGHLDIIVGLVSRLYFMEPD